ncbi:MAG TPA: hypothetical protein VNL77_03520 [Roseiflexaceae bacterium]|nr:hypothetical protein [Roseiflexaceae bacterium]
MVKLEGRKAAVAGAVALALVIAGCAAQSQMRADPLRSMLGPGGIVIQQPAAPALQLDTAVRLDPAGPQFGRKATTDDTARAIQAQEAVAVHHCGMEK